MVQKGWMNTACTLEGDGQNGWDTVTNGYIMMVKMLSIYLGYQWLMMEGDGQNGWD